MSKNTKATIIYKKNGKVKTKISKWYNRRNLLKNIIAVSNNHVHDTHSYEFNSDLELIHFKNFEFNNLNDIVVPSNNNCLCIFENCTFNYDAEAYNWQRELTFMGSHIRLINPKFINISKINKNYYSQIQSKHYSLDKIEFIFDENDPNENDFKLDIEIDAKEIIIHDNYRINDLKLRGHNIIIENNFDLKWLQLEGNNVTIGSKDTNCHTNISTQNFKPMIDVYQILTLSNCTITNNHQELFNLEVPKLEYSNATINSKTGILINGFNFQEESLQEYYTVTDEDLLKAKLITALKTYNQKLIREINGQSKNYFKETEQYDKGIKQKMKEVQIQKDVIKTKETELNKKIEELIQIKNTILAKEFATLDNLKDSLSEKQAIKHQAIIKSLSKKPGKYFKK